LKEVIVPVFVAILEQSQGLKHLEVIGSVSHIKKIPNFELPSLKTLKWVNALSSDMSGMMRSILKSNNYKLKRLLLI